MMLGSSALDSEGFGKAFGLERVFLNSEYDMLARQCIIGKCVLFPSKQLLLMDAIGTTFLASLENSGEGFSPSVVLRKICYCDGVDVWNLVASETRGPFKMDLIGFNGQLFCVKENTVHGFSLFNGKQTFELVKKDDEKLLFSKSLSHGPLMLLQGDEVKVFKGFEREVDLASSSLEPKKCSCTKYFGRNK